MMYKNKKKISFLPSVLLVVILSSITLFSCLSIPKVFFGNLTEEQFINLQNNVNSMAVKSTIKITTKINSFIHSKKELGSGVILDSKEDEDSYSYIALTNYHVISDAASLSVGWKQEREVYDYKNNKYDRYNILAFNKEKDLALILFHAQKENNTEFLPAIKRSRINPTKDTLVISIGYPMGQVNSVTYGKVEGYKYVNIQQEDNSVLQTDFKALSHSAPGNHGSSGGPLFDRNLNLVGLNFAGGQADQTGYSKDMWAIPVEIINNFIKSYNEKVQGIND